MKLSISNIAWSESDDSNIYYIMRELGFSGLEIAPTRVLSQNPYDRINEAYRWKQNIFDTYGFVITSLQSIWYGRTENMFASEKDRKLLFDYTKKVIDFAHILDCRNIVFGCPRNRNIPQGMKADIIIPFFKELGDYAYSKNTVIGFEANPVIYNTNYMNDTLSAINLVKTVHSKGFLLNLDIGTMIENKESVEEIIGNVKYINHVHISEPGLEPIKMRKLHKDLIQILNNEEYAGYFSIEMRKTDYVGQIKEIMNYVKEIEKITEG